MIITFTVSGTIDICFLFRHHNKNNSNKYVLGSTDKIEKRIIKRVKKIIEKLLVMVKTWFL